MGNREFDAQVVRRNKDLVKLSENFVLLRLSHMRGVNINLFKFDYDENWMGMFMDADGLTYARYGSVDPETRVSHNCVEGLAQTMNAVLAIHKEESAKSRPEYKLPDSFRPEQIPARADYCAVLWLVLLRPHRYRWSKVRSNRTLHHRPYGLVVSAKPLSTAAANASRPDPWRAVRQ